MIEKRLRQLNEAHEQKRLKLGDMQDEHDMLVYVNNYDDTQITDRAYKRHRKLQEKREMEQRREAILKRYLKPTVKVVIDQPEDASEIVFKHTPQQNKELIEI